jgi:hypothetical protein
MQPTKAEILRTIRETAVEAWGRIPDDFWIILLILAALGLLFAMERRWKGIERDANR